MIKYINFGILLLIDPLLNTTHNEQMKEETVSKEEKKNLSTFDSISTNNKMI